MVSRCSDAEPLLNAVRRSRPFAAPFQVPRSYSIGKLRQDHEETQGWFTDLGLPKGLPLLGPGISTLPLSRALSLVLESRKSGAIRMRDAISATI
jgi:hypothetical protein